MPERLLRCLAATSVEPRDFDPHCLHRTVTMLGKSTVEVRASSAPAIDYLRRLFTPGNTRWRVDDSQATPTRTVRFLTVDEDTIADVVDRLRRETKDQARLPTRLHVSAPAVWHGLPDGRRMLLVGGDGNSISPQAVFMDRYRRDIGIVCADTPDAIMNLARHIREIGYRLAENDGWVCIHASAATYAGRTVAIIGDSGAGKTSLAVSLSAQPGWEFLANDRLMIRLGADGKLSAVALPCPIRLNGGTLAGLNIDGALDWDVARPKPEATGDWLAFRGSAKLNVLPAEWHAITGTPIGSDGRVEAVILPQVEFGSHELRIATARGGVRDRIMAQCMSPDDPVYVEDWLGARHISTEDVRRNSDRVVHALASLPSFTVAFGTELPLARVAGSTAAAVASRW